MSSPSSESEPRSRSSTTSQSFSLINDSSSDEIVWDISSDYRSSEDNESTESSVDSDAEEDFILLSRPHSPRPHIRSGLSTPNPSHLPPSVSAITSELARLSIPQLDSSRLSSPAKIISTPVKKHTSSPLPPSLSTSASESASKNRSKRRSRKERRESRRKAQENERGIEHGVKALGLGSRPIVDDVSESGLSNNIENDSFVYEEAAGYITSFLRNPSAYDERSSRLTLLQSLIIELGLSSPSMPSSMTSAKALLKSQVFVNIREYLAVRDQGPEALRQAIYPSRSALIKSIRKQPKTRASLEWVKEHGLSVLLVTAFRH